MKKKGLLDLSGQEKAKSKERSSMSRFSSEVQAGKIRTCNNSQTRAQAQHLARKKAFSFKSGSRTRGVSADSDKEQQKLLRLKTKMKRTVIMNKGLEGAKPAVRNQSLQLKKQVDIDNRNGKRERGQTSERTD